MVTVITGASERLQPVDGPDHMPDRMMAVDLAEYRDHMRRRSPKWETVALPAEDFRSLARPIEEWL